MNEDNRIIGNPGEEKQIPKLLRQAKEDGFIDAVVKGRDINPVIQEPTLGDIIGFDLLFKSKERIVNLVDDVAFSPDGNYFSFCSANSAFLFKLDAGGNNLTSLPRSIRNLENLKGLMKESHLKPLAQHAGGDMIKSVSLSPNAEYLAIAARNYVIIKRFDGNEFEVGYLPEKNFPNIVHAVEFSKDGKHLVVGGAGILKTYEFDGKNSFPSEEIKEISRHEDSPQTTYLDVSLAPDGKRVVAGSSDDNLHTFDLDDNFCLIPDDYSSFPHRFTNAIAVSPDNKYVATGTSRNFSLIQFTKGWAFNDVFLHSDVNKPPAANCIAFSPDGKYMAVGNGRHLEMYHVLRKEK